MDPLNVIVRLSRAKPEIALPVATLLLVFNIFTTTYIEHRKTLRWLRLALSLPTLSLWWSTSYPVQHYPNWDTGLYSPLFYLAFYYFLRALDVCVVGFWDEDEDVARWQLRRPSEGKKEHDAKSGTLPLPTSLTGRLGYTLDLLLSMKGASFYKKRVWNWAPQSIKQYRAPPGGYKTLFLQRLTVISLAISTMLAVAIIGSSRKWDTAHPQPLTGHDIPLLKQMFYGPAFGAWSYSGFILFPEFFLITVVPLFRLDLESWIPLCQHPLTAHSLTSFWARSQHQTYTQIFLRLGKPILSRLPQISEHDSVRQGVRYFTIFLLSALIHMFMPWSHPSDPDHYIAFWDWSTLKFFGGQPFGILIEMLVIKPLTKHLPRLPRQIVDRVFLWIFLCWSLRWYADYYLPWGDFDSRQKIFGPEIAAFIDSLGM